MDSNARTISFTLDGSAVDALPGETILQAAKREVLEETGIALFTRVDRPIDDVVHLTASADWHALPRHARIGNLRVLARRWARLRGGARPTWVEVLDRQGDVVLSVRRGR